MRPGSSGGGAAASAWRVPLLAALPLLGGIAGAAVDERLRLGFTVWRAACRASGLSPGSLARFTIELLPCALIGALAGGLALLASAAGGAVSPRLSLSAHLGCIVAMPAGLVLCALALPMSLAVGAEWALATGLALGIGYAWRRA